VYAIFVYGGGASAAVCWWHLACLLLVLPCVWCLVSSAALSAAACLVNFAGYPGQPRQQEGTNVLANLLGGYGENE
jgi:hypothetical protein